MKKEAIASPRAPAAIGPYSQAIRVSAPGFVFLSGQIGLTPGKGELVEGGVEPETKQVLENLRNVLAAAGVGFQNVVRATIYLTDLGDFELVNKLYGQCFSGPPPARSTVQVAGLPKGAKVEIDLIAAL